MKKLKEETLKGLKSKKDELSQTISSVILGAKLSSAGQIHIYVYMDVI